MRAWLYDPASKGHWKAARAACAGRWPAENSRCRSRGPRRGYPSEDSHGSPGITPPETRWGPRWGDTAPVTSTHGHNRPRSRSPSHSPRPVTDSQSATGISIVSGLPLPSPSNRVVPAWEQQPLVGHESQDPVINWTNTKGTAIAIDNSVQARRVLRTGSCVAVTGSLGSGNPCGGRGD